ncbi:MULTISPECIES: hypothetical protein [unclassified Desulfovibrio]|uniref:hypothetical protein n=1 Tax=unclassified Desulfovibrio TaxID=2593640 RepID=UPI0013ED94C0|nr:MULTISPECIES: hypothetical protein [unclassified Desulfovibrio]
MPTDNSPNSATPEAARKDGTRNIPADELEKIPTRTSPWQWAVIIVAAVILIAIGLTFRGAEERENKAAMQNLGAPFTAIVQEQAAALGLTAPKMDLQIATKAADVSLDFPGAIGADKARDFAVAVCAGLARTYVNKGYMPRDLAVHVMTTLADGARAVYGKAVFNGNLDQLLWEPAQ